MRANRHAFTVLELLVIVAVTFLLVAVFLRAQPAASAKANRISCANNLMQVGLAFRLWSGDCGDKYPMQEITNATYGSFELNGTNGFRYFQVMSNELSTPYILVCPADLKRTAATNFTSNFDRPNLSYFVGLEADETMPQTFLAGDRNLSNGQPMTNGLFYFQTNQAIYWTEDLHNQAGNELMSDGSVRQLDNSQISAVLANTGLVTNRFWFP